MRTELGAENRNANTERRIGAYRKGDDIAERLLDLGAAVIRLLAKLGRKPAGRTVVKQLERCGPAGGSNYEEARGAESPADFVHKTRIALKEVRETRYWLRLAVRAELLDADDHAAMLIDEADQLVAILTASANTVRRRVGRGS
jgi:four helix bundle protein